jgi:CHAT domain-containing protein/tetratricopeptide (TPR) repeat protein
MSEPQLISYAERASLSCPVCGELFPADLWLIIDVAERPDLAEQGRSGRLRRVRCPNGHTAAVDAILLLYFRDQSPPVLFVPTATASEAENAALARALLDMLRQRVGAAWSEAWVADGPARISWPAVPLALTEGPGAALRYCDQLAEEAAELQRVQNVIERLDRPEATPSRLDYLRATLAGVSRGQQAFLWAGLQVQLGNALVGDFHGSRAENLGRAIACYQAALGVYTREDFPVEWAMTQFHLAMAYRSLPGEDRQENLERAIACYEQSLTVLTPEAFPWQWAVTHFHLGLAYKNLPEGDRRQNLERAITCFQAALQVYTREDFPAEWADTQFLLGLAYRDLPGGDRRQNLEQAIACYERSLTVRTREAFPVEWAMTQHNLGVAHANLPGRDRQQNLERAIACFQAALQIYTREDFPAEWGTTQDNLGNAYSNLHGEGWDKQQNLERAIACYEQSLTVRTRDAFPTDWAATQNNLGLAYSFLPGGDRQENLRRAIACFQAALQVYTRENAPADWAMTLNNLGLAYGDLLLGDRQQNLRQALACFQAALELYTRAAFPVEWAKAQSNLGNVYSNLSGEGGDRRQNLERALACYEQSLSVLTREAFPADWAKTQINLGEAYGKLPGGNERAVAVWRQALDYVHDILLTSLEPRHLAAAAARLVRQVIPPLLELGRPADVVGVLEQGRALGLRLELTRTARTPTGLSAAEQEEYRDLAAAARDLPSARRRLDAGTLPSADRAAGLVEFGQRYQQVLARLRELEQRDPAFPLAPPSFACLTRLAAARDLALVYLQPTDEPSLGAVGVLIHRDSPADAPGREDVVRLPGLSVADIEDILFRIPEHLPFAVEQLDALLAAGRHGRQLGWFPAYLLGELAGPRRQKDAAAEVWHGALRRALDELAPVLAPLIDRLRQVHAPRVVLLPGGSLAVLPLHAVPVTGTRDGAEVFGEEFAISYTPSAVSLSLSLDRAQRNRSSPPCLTAIANPEGAEPPLPFADEEAIAVANRFGGHAQVARGRDATRAWLDPRTADAHFLELATNASFVLDTPSESRMTLAPGGPKDGLSLDDLWGGRYRIREGCVVTASACETGQIDFRGESDESLGFPAAFLGLGASSVIASLWAVNDLSTALLMDKVYELLLQRGCPSAVAVQQASHWLRKLPREDVRRWLEARRAAVEQALAQFNVPQGGLTPERLDAEKDLEDRLELFDSALEKLDGQPDTPFAHPVFWAAFAAYGA